MPTDTKPMTATTALDPSDYRARSHEAALHRRFLVESAHLRSEMTRELEDQWKLALTWEDLAADSPDDHVSVEMARISKTLLNQQLMLVIG